MSEFLVSTHRQVRTANSRGDTSQPNEAFDAVWRRYEQMFTTGDEQFSARVHSKIGGRVAHIELRRLLDRFGALQDDVLRFTTDFAVPFDINQAIATSECLNSADKSRDAYGQRTAPKTSSPSAL